SAGLGAPFLLSAVALGAFLKLFKRYRPFIPVVERFAGVILVVVGLLVFTNYYLVLNSWAIALTPDWLLRRLCGRRARFGSRTNRVHSGFDAGAPEDGRPPGRRCS